MTITYATLTLFAPIAVATGLIGAIHRHGLGRCVRSLAACLWALSMAVPAGLAEFRAVYLGIYGRTMSAEAEAA